MNNVQTRQLIASLLNEAVRAIQDEVEGRYRASAAFHDHNNAMFGLAACRKHICEMSQRLERLERKAKPRARRRISRRHK